VKRKTAKANVKTRTRLFSLLLAVLMTLFCFHVTALGGGESDSESASVVPDAEQNSAGTASDEEFFGEVEEFIPWELELEEGDLDLLTLKTAELDPSEKPEIISYALIEEKQHVNRLYEQEPDVFTIMFQNRDGGKTVYVFSHPVKTVSPSGVYTDMTAAQIQAAVNSTSASTNATGIASSSLSLTASGSKMQIDLGSDFIKSRLGNLDAEKPIMSYNIGEFVIFKARASTLTNGISDITYDVTDEAREWATPGSEVPKFTFVPEISDTQIEADDNVSLGGSVGIITPTVEEEIVVMSTTTSNIAGEYSIKSTSDNKYIMFNPSVGLLTSPALSAPYCKWYFQYLGSSGYRIIPMARQDLCLSYFDGEMTFLGAEDPDGSIWSLRAEGSNTFSFLIGDNYLSNTLEMLPESINPPFAWLLSNPCDEILLTSMSISNIMIEPGQSIGVPEITKNSDITAYTSSDEYFEWVSLDSENIGYNIDDGFYVNETYGVYRIYCRYKFNPTIISNTAVIIISDDYDITSGAVYLIRPYQTTIDSSTKLLTMSVGSDSNSLSLSGWETDWHDSSQAFTITDVGSYAYKISAILSTNQYNVTFDSSDLPYDNEYLLPNKNTLSNTLSMTNDRTLQLHSYTAVATQKWYIYFKNDECHFVNASFTSYNLLYSSANNSVFVTNTNTNQSWYITRIGIDVPCIKQITDYYCGVASTLQVIYGVNSSKANTLGNNLCEQLYTLAGEDHMNVSAGSSASYTAIKNALKNILNTDYSDQYFKTTSVISSRIIGSINKGYPLIAKVESRKLSYYPDSYAYNPNNQTFGKHYICIMGYDIKTDKVIINDCNYNDNYFGIRAITFNDLYNAETVLFHYSYYNS